MSNRLLKMTIPTHRVKEGGGFWVRRPAAMGSLMSPFLLLDEMGPADYGPGEAIGAPWHPHRGFETVTYMLAGQMQHEDSAGNKGDLNPGDVQWMTAGKGIIHSEQPHDDFQKTGGLMHGFQIWVNLPAKDKMMAPRYQEIPSSESPIDGIPGIGAFTSILNPASSAALAVVGPKAAILVPFCLKVGKFLINDCIPDGL